MKQTPHVLVVAREKYRTTFRFESLDRIMNRAEFFGLKPRDHVGAGR
jgi:hypothetical protein